jgi:hypothetical protein
MKVNPLFFDFDRKTLDEKENMMLDILIELGEVVHGVWQEQVPNNHTTLYPPDATKEEVLKASKKDPELLSPYTVVRRDEKGKLYAVEYSEEYKEEIDKMLELMERASNLANGFANRFGSYLKDLAKNIRSGDWDGALITYLKNGDSKFEILIGPIESYNDRLLGIKKTFQYNVRVRRDGDMEEVRRLSESVENVPIIKPYLSVTTGSRSAKVKIRIDDAVMFSGRLAGARAASTNLPNETELAEKYGTKVVVYANSLDLKFKDLFLPYLKSFKGLEFDLNEKAMSDAAKRIIVLHELTEGLVKFPGMQRRLESDYDAIRELNAYLLGTKSSEVHLLNGYLTTEQFYQVYIMLLVIGLDKFSRMADSSVLEYARGFSALYNYLIEKKAIVIKKKEIYLDINKIIAGVDSMTSVVLALLHEGTYEDSQKFFDEYTDFSLNKKLPLLEL